MKEDPDEKADKAVKSDDTSADESTSPETKKEASHKADGEGVVVSEEYQQKAHELLHKATKHEVSHVRDRAYHRDDELRKEEEDAKKPKGKKGDFSTSDAPPSLAEPS